MWRSLNRATVNSASLLKSLALVDADTLAALWAEATRAAAHAPGRYSSPAGPLRFTSSRSSKRATSTLSSSAASASSTGCGVTPEGGDLPRSRPEAERRKSPAGSTCCGTSASRICSTRVHPDEFPAAVLRGPRRGTREPRGAWWKCLRSTAARRCCRSGLTGPVQRRLGRPFRGAPRLLGAARDDGRRRALDAAHRVGLVHGRLTSDTFVLTADGLLKVTGFGEAAVARVSRPRLRLSRCRSRADLRAFGQVAFGWSQLGRGRSGWRRRRAFPRNAVGGDSSAGGGRGNRRWRTRFAAAQPYQSAGETAGRPPAHRPRHAVQRRCVGEAAQARRGTTPPDSPAGFAEKRDRGPTRPRRGKNERLRF